MVFSIEDDSKYRRSQDILFRAVADELVIVPASQDSSNNNALFTLKGSGKLIWEMLDGQNTVAQLVERLISEYDAPRDQIRQDVMAFMEELAMRGLIVIE